MKRVKLSLTIVAFVLGLGTAIASNVKGSTSYFYLDSSGDPVTKISGSPNCQSGNDPCAQLYNLDANGDATTPAGPMILGITHS